MENIPLGVGRSSLELYSVDCRSRVVYPIAAQELYQTVPFVEELINILYNKKIPVTVFDAEKLLADSLNYQCRLLRSEPEALVQELFAEVVNRNNDYKDAKLDASVLDKYEEKLIIFVGLKKLYDQLTADGKEKFELLIEKCEAIYRIHFIIVEAAQPFNSFNYSAWFKRHVPGMDGLWIGEGVTEQYILKLNRVSTDLYEEIGGEYGYIIRRNRPTLAKLLSARKGEE